MKRVAWKSIDPYPRRAPRDPKDVVQYAVGDWEFHDGRVDKECRVRIQWRDGDVSHMSKHAFEKLIGRPVADAIEE